MAARLRFECMPTLTTRQRLAAWLGGVGALSGVTKKQFLQEKRLSFFSENSTKTCHGFDVILIFVQRFFVQKKRVILVLRGKGGASEESKRGSKKAGKQIKTIALTIQKKDVQVGIRCQRKRAVDAVFQGKPAYECRKRAHHGASTCFAGRLRHSRAAPQTVLRHPPSSPARRIL